MHLYMQLEIKALCLFKTGAFEKPTDDELVFQAQIHSALFPSAFVQCNFQVMSCQREERISG